MQVVNIEVIETHETAEEECQNDKWVYIISRSLCYALGFAIVAIYVYVILFIYFGLYRENENL